MRWPSVYFWGWIMVPGRVLVLVGALGLAVVTDRLLQEWFGSAPGPTWLILPWFIVLGLGSWLLIRCPRCGRDAYSRSGAWANNLWPVRTCTKCGLDLRQHHPFDSTAKRGT